MKNLFILSALLAVASAPGLEDILAKGFILDNEHLAVVEHQRRIFHQYDPAVDVAKTLFGSDMDKLMDYLFDHVDQPESQLDAICLDISNEGLAQYPSDILPQMQHPGLLKWLAKGQDYYARLIEEGHRRGTEIWWGHRMNAVERGHRGASSGGHIEMQHLNPAKAAHPDWLIRSWWWQGNWNYAVKGVREYKLAIIEQVIDKYDFDGVHLDFLRHTPHLPPGKQWENRKYMTAFLTDLRAILQEKAVERGRPILLAARVPESLKGCHTDGYDIETWAQQGLVDLLLIGTRTMQVDLTSFRNVTQNTHVNLLPSFDCFHTTDGYQGIDQPLEFIRGVFANYWYQGADGVGIFNYAAGSTELAKKIGVSYPVPDWQQKAICSIGSLKTLSGKKRIYAIDRRGGYLYGEGHFSSNLWVQLPVTLGNDKTPTKVILYVWEPVEMGTNAFLRLILSQRVESDDIKVLLDGIFLKKDIIDPHWKDPGIYFPDHQPETMSPGAIKKDLCNQQLTRIEFKVPIHLLQRGENVIAISADRTGPFLPLKYIRIEKVELHLK